MPGGTAGAFFAPVDDDVDCSIVEEYIVDIVVIIPDYLQVLVLEN